MAQPPACDGAAHRSLAELSSEQTPSGAPGCDGKPLRPRGTGDTSSSLAAVAEPILKSAAVSKLAPSHQSCTFSAPAYRGPPSAFSSDTAHAPSPEGGRRAVRPVRIGIDTVALGEGPVSFRRRLVFDRRPLIATVELYLWFPFLGGSARAFRADSSAFDRPLSVRSSTRYRCQERQELHTDVQEALEAVCLASRRSLTKLRE